MVTGAVARVRIGATREGHRVRLGVRVRHAGDRPAGDELEPGILDRGPGDGRIGGPGRQVVRRRVGIVRARVVQRVRDGARDLVVQVAGNVGPGQGGAGAPVDLEAAGVRQIGARLQRPDRPGNRDLVDHGFDDARGDLSLVGRSRVDEQAGRDLDGGDPEPCGCPTDGRCRWSVDFDPCDPGPQVHFWKVREQGRVDRRQVSGAHHQIGPGVGERAIETGLDPDVGVRQVRAIRPIEDRARRAHRILVKGARAVARHRLHARRPGVAVVVEHPERPVDLRAGGDQVAGGGRIIEPVDGQPRPGLCDVHRRRRVPLVLRDRAFGLGHHQVGQPEQGQDHAHQCGDDQGRSLLIFPAQVLFRRHARCLLDHGRS